MKTNRRFQSLFAIPMVCAAMIQPVSQACTRAVYFGKDGQTVTGRTMDWYINEANALASSSGR